MFDGIIFSLAIGFLLAIIAVPFFVDIHNLEDDYEDYEDYEDE
ncbi:MAG: hypothetical protein Q4E83_03800 [bacterium]|nr:hypothetical protein [bacterium]